MLSLNIFNLLSFAKIKSSFPIIKTYLPDAIFTEFIAFKANPNFTISNKFNAKFIFIFIYNLLWIIRKLSEIQTSKLNPLPILMR